MERVRYDARASYIEGFILNYSFSRLVSVIQPWEGDALSTVTR